MNFEELKIKATSLPLQPGVYLMRDRDNHVIYVGKQKNCVIVSASIFWTRHLIHQKLALWLAKYLISMSLSPRVNLKLWFWNAPRLSDICRNTIFF